MPRHLLQPLPRAFAGTKDVGSKRHSLNDDGIWERLDRVQALGNATEGHRGCVNALSWSDDGSVLLSGSDDKRICIWGADTSSSSSSPSSSPHPLKLMDTIHTGHRANIFSAKFLPNTSTPTIVSCAGDRDVRVFEVERLGRADFGMGGNVRNELAGVDGPGVTVLRCHTDRTKRIATETSPFLFLTVAEDGTVRQHDLRRPHRCRAECPEPLFHAPKGVDLYSLSVSTVTPHLFAVAGRTDCAFVCDRRMPERQTPSWGARTMSAGQVHCVRRLGLPKEEWDCVNPSRGRRSRFSVDNHITCVRMSPDKADEVICAFARHSTSLFSLYDSPGPSSLRMPSTSPASRSSDRRAASQTRLQAGGDIAPVEDPNHSCEEQASPATDVNNEIGRDSPRVPEVASKWLVPTDEERKVKTPTPKEEAARTDRELPPMPNFGKRRISDVTSSSATPIPTHRSRLQHQHEERSCDEQEVRLPYEHGEEERLGDEQDVGIPLDHGEEGSLYDEQDVGLAYDHGEEDGEMADALGSTSVSQAADPSVDQTYVSPPGNTEPMMPEVRDIWADEAVRISVEDSPDELEGGMDLDDLTDLERIMEDDEEDDEFDDEEDDFDFESEPDEILDFDFPHGRPEAFKSVDMIEPRRSFKGAKNTETVKDCNFLGVRSDKVCSGSDDGNFFVWDKETGRLEGIWEGDGHIVNVMEQHPSLPIVAVSGIDSTVKLFSPSASRPDPSFVRTHLRNTILRANTNLDTPRAHFSRGIISIEDFIAARGITIRTANAGEMPDVATTANECATQ